MKKIFILGLAVLGLLVSYEAQSQFNIDAGSTNYTQNFDALTPAGTWTDNTTLTGWYARTDATASIASFALNTGTTTTAALYSFGTTSDRALGYGVSNAYFGAAGTGKGYMGWRLKNNTGNPVSSISVTWTGEQWRKDNNAAAHTLNLMYQTGATVTSLVNGTWTTASSTFTSPITGATTATALDGNLSANRTAGITATITVTIPAGEEIMLRWEDLNDSGSDHLMAIDDVTVNATVASGPILTVSPSNLTGFTYIEGSGPSASQNYTLSGSSLTADGNITVTGTTNYEVSSDGTNFAGSFDVAYSGTTLANTTVYVRLKAGLSTGTYNSETVANAGGGATTKNVTCSGSVTAPPPPTITVTPTTLSGFTYLAGSGPSTSQSYSVSAANLTPAADFITITAPTNYEISEDNVSFAGTITLPYASSALSSTTIYVRLKAGLAAGTYNSELVANAGGGATTTNVTCSGTVTVPPAHYRNKQSGDWTDPSIWEYSTDLMTWSNAVTAPTTTDLSVTLTSPYSVTISASRSIDQVTVASGSTLELTGGTLTIADGTGTDLLVQGILRNSTTSAFTLSGSANIEVDNGGIYEHNPSTGGGAMTAMTWAAGSTCKILKANVTSAPSGLNQSYYNFTWASSTQTATCNLSGNLLTINGDFRLENNGQILRLIGGTTNTVTVTGDVYVASGTNLQMGSGASVPGLTIGGDLFLDGTVTLSAGTAPQSPGTLKVGGDIVAGTAGLLTEINTSTAHILELNGSSNQNISLNAITTDINLVINNAAGVTLGTDASTFRSLTLTNGQVKTNGYTLGISGTITGQSATNFVCTCNSAGTMPSTAGGLRLPVAASSSVVFPVGPTPDYYMPVTIASAASHTSDNLTARVETLGTAGAAPAVPAKCIQYQWNINEAVAGGSNVSLKLQWAAGTEGGSFNPGVSPQIGHWDGSGFDPIIAASYNAGDPSFTSSANFTSFSPFVAASEAAALPVEIVTFGAKKVQQSAILSFSTASELNNSHFDIERSTDGRTFEKIGEVKGAGDSQVAVYYTFTDRQPARGTNYYRLRQVDFDGTASLSKVVSLQFGQAGGVVLFPTPVAETMNVRFDEAFATDANWQVVDVNGRVVSEGVFAAEQKDFSIPVATLMQGAYVLRVTSGQQTIAQQFRKL